MRAYASASTHRRNSSTCSPSESKCSTLSEERRFRVCPPRLRPRARTRYGYNELLRRWATSVTHLAVLKPKYGGAVLHDRSDAPMLSPPCRIRISARPIARRARNRSPQRSRPTQCLCPISTGLNTQTDAAGRAPTMIQCSLQPRPERGTDAVRVAGSPRLCPDSMPHPSGFVVASLLHSQRKAHHIPDGSG